MQKFTAAVALKSSVRDQWCRHTDAVREIMSAACCRTTFTLIRETIASESEEYKLRNCGVAAADLALVRCRLVLSCQCAQRSQAD